MSIFSLRRAHRLVGIVMLLPFIAWSLTAIFFLLRPAYIDAYAPLPLASGTLPPSIEIEAEEDWQELRLLRSVLGEHLLVRRNSGWQHLDAQTSMPFPLPSPEQMELLLEAAFQVNPTRYGSLISVDGLQARSDTGVKITVDWERFAAAQTGRDTRWVDRMYAIHYLRWTGHAGLDKFLGITGLLLLLYMTWSGGRMVFTASPRSRQRSSREVPASAQGFPD